MMELCTKTTPFVNNSHEPRACHSTKKPGLSEFFAKAPRNTDHCSLFMQDAS